MSLVLLCMWHRNVQRSVDAWDANTAVRYLEDAYLCLLGGLASLLGELVLAVVLYAVYWSP